MIPFFLAIVSLLTGAAFTLQSAVNGRLRNVSQNPLFASAASFAGGLLLLPWMLLGAHLLGIYMVPSAEMLLETKPWMYIGGLIGIGLVLGSIVIPKRIGFAPYFSLLVAGQLVGSVIADAAGFLESEVHLPGPARIAGVVCLIAGAVLAQKR